MSTSSGIPRTANRDATPCASSTLSLTTFSAPAFSRPVFSTTGETTRHGPHQGAQKSTKTGSDDVISRSKLSAVASTIHGRSAWQAAHRGTPVGVDRTRFFLPQVGQAVTVPSDAMTRPMIRAANLRSHSPEARAPGWRVARLGASVRYFRLAARQLPAWTDEVARVAVRIERSEARWRLGGAASPPAVGRPRPTVVNYQRATTGLKQANPRSPLTDSNR